MRKFRWWASTGLQCSKISGEFDVEDDATEEQIEEQARDEIFNFVDIGWAEIEEPSDV